jgi:chemotaxis protein histidine kinase CheA
MSDDEPKDESTDDSEKETGAQPTEGDQPAEQSEDQSTQSDQPAEQSDGQPAEQADQSEQQPEEQPTDSDQPAEQTEDKPADSDQPVEQSEEQPSDSDQPAEPSEEQPADDQSAEQPEEQPADSDQPATAASAGNTLAFAGGDAPPGGGGGAAGRSGSGKSTKVQVIARFFTLKTTTQAGGTYDPFLGGSITMNVFDGDKGNLLWKPGSMNQLKVTYQDPPTKQPNFTEIRSPMLSGVTGDSVKVELKVRMLGPQSELDPQNYSQVNFGTAARFEVPTDGTLKVNVIVEVTEKQFTVDAKDEDSAMPAAAAMLTTKEERNLSMVKSVAKVGDGRFRVVLTIPTKKIRIDWPPDPRRYPGGLSRERLDETGALLEVIY